MKLSRRVSWFLVAFGVWSWIVWTTFVKNLWKDVSGLAFHHGDHSQPTAYFWIHLALAITSTILGTAIAVLGLRGLRALRPAEPPAPAAPEPAGQAYEASSSSSVHTRASTPDVRAK